MISSAGTLSPATHAVKRQKVTLAPMTSAGIGACCQIKTTSPLLAVVRRSYATGQPVPWVQIHQVPDFVYFNHSIHIARGVSCIECHGPINTMDTVRHDKPLSMGFCLDCHRDPAPHLRPPGQVTNLDWKAPSAADQLAMGNKFVHDWKVNPPQSCSGCHR